MKNPLIKICGITSEEEIRYIAKAGIDYAGFVLFFPKSKRNLSLECAKKLIAKLPAGVVSVAVTVSPTKEQVEAVVEAGFLAIQIHGKIEDSVITSCRIPVFKAFNVSDMDAFSHYEEMDEVAGFVMDAAVPGSGKTFDWHLIPPIGKPFFLAGGISLENVHEAQNCRPYCLDVSSAVETEGRKDPEKIRRMVEAVRQSGKQSGG